MIVIDASVAVKLINTQEEGSILAQDLLLQHIKGKEKITVPHLLFLEVANALATKSTVTKKDMQEGILILYKAQFEVEELQQSILLEATLLAKKYKTSVYDMLYAVMAEKKHATLITADAKFVAKTKFPFVKLLSNLS